MLTAERSCLEIERYYTFCAVEQTDRWPLSAVVTKTFIALGHPPCSARCRLRRLSLKNFPGKRMKAQTTTIPFRKTAACPSAARLLLLRTGKLATQSSTQVSEHLETCDFCNAELRLLAHHRRTKRKDRVPEIPKNLRILAESILGKREPTR
jgi:hypothetical protein